MANKFSKGSVVVLKSGGPPMTVDQVPGDRSWSGATSARDDYHTRWFKGASKESGDFAEHLLNEYEPPAVKK